MPGRLMTRGTRDATASTHKGARCATHESGSIPDTVDEGKDTALRRAICLVFAEAQRSIAAHRKAIISLRKLQESCCYEAVNGDKQSNNEDYEEDDFNREVVRCVLRLLPVKKAEPVGDRVIRFLGTFLSAAMDKDNKMMESDDASVPETPTSRLTTAILSTLLHVLSAKDKTVRFRATQITSHIINSMDTLDDSLFHSLKQTLLKRIHDKEAPVRLQAVYGLGRLAAEVEDNEDDNDSDSDDEFRSGVLEKLLNVLQNDPAAEVRRNLLLNLPLTKDVLPYLLERARDADGSTRRALYAKLLPALGDFRHLSLTHREKLLRWGLRDRDEHVRRATARLFRERWIEDCAALPAADATEHGDKEQLHSPTNRAAKPSLDALLELLERIDIVNSGVEGGIAQVAMKEFWAGRPDYVDYVSFPDSFWEDLSPELVFVARTFNDFCRKSGKEDCYDGPQPLDVMIEEKLPEVTRFGFLLERELVRLAQMINDPANEKTDEEESVQREFVVEQMLHMALTFDYSDEVGRRKMFTLMRTALAEPSMPEEVTRLTIEILRLVCGEDARGERDFCGIVLEAVAEVHDAVLGNDEETEMQDSSVEESFHSATSHLGSDDGASRKPKPVKSLARHEAEHDEDKAMKEIVVNMKCLHIALCMLENVQGALGMRCSLLVLFLSLTAR
nr:condensin complex subunit 3 [Quercus suber]